MPKKDILFISKVQRMQAPTPFSVSAFQVHQVEQLKHNWPPQKSLEILENVKKKKCSSSAVKISRYNSHYSISFRHKMWLLFFGIMEESGIKHPSVLAGLYLWR